MALSEPYEAWLDVSIDHVIPRETVKRLGYPRDWVEDIANLVTSCRACNEFLNGYRVTDPLPGTLEEFFALRDRHFVAKRSWVLARHEREQAQYRLWVETRGVGRGAVGRGESMGDVAGQADATWPGA